MYFLSDWKVFYSFLDSILCLSVTRVIFVEFSFSITRSVFCFLFQRWGLIYAAQIGLELGVDSPAFYPLVLRLQECTTTSECALSLSTTFNSFWGKYPAKYYMVLYIMWFIWMTPIPLATIHWHPLTLTFSSFLSLELSCPYPSWMTSSFILLPLSSHSLSVEVQCLMKQSHKKMIFWTLYMYGTPE